ncbi:zinc finger protein RFP-like, partial [Mauremys mutica]|uniref:zinc finger protein RFP-like n=1 Tax=Mauremys mutica TaxID=74926 RepID=UPI001D1656F0
MIEIAKWLSLQAAKGTGGDGVCGEHQEALKLFCEEDQTPICVVCDRSWAHRTHMVVPIQEAAQEYKERIQAHLKTLREEREKLLGLKATGEGNCREYLKQTQTERQKIVSEFHQL